MVIPLPNDQEWQDMQTHVDVVRLSRNEFVNEVFVDGYEPGEHVAFIGPTRSGKTTIAFDLLNAVASPELPAVVLVMKPKDDVVVNWSKLAGFRKTEHWPPVFRWAVTKRGGGLGKKQRGWVFWPRQSLSNIRRDDKMLAREFGKAITECYKKGNRIIFADEVVGLSDELGLKTELKAVWSRGGGLGCGMWAATQRPFEAPLLMYGSSVHLILFNDPDKRSRDRFKEIGGVDPDTVENIVTNLKKYEFLYIGRTMAEDRVSPALAIVNAS